mmetsp:Transcript_2080/g.4544  ORF Transcript_2080/g.4544 Transcript_2080/m.4544 type:complete len:208 (-) Transcript_2080:64-687(-)
MERATREQQRDQGAAPGAQEQGRRDQEPPPREGVARVGGVWVPAGDRDARTQLRRAGQGLPGIGLVQVSQQRGGDTAPGADERAHGHVGAVERHLRRPGGDQDAGQGRPAGEGGRMEGSRVRAVVRGQRAQEPRGQGSRRGRHDRRRGGRGGSGHSHGAHRGTRQEDFRTGRATGRRRTASARVAQSYSRAKREHSCVCPYAALPSQ